MKGLSKEEIGSLCGELCHLTGSGISMGDGLSLMAEEETRPDRRELLEKMASLADEGVSPAQIFRQMGVFPEYLSSLLEVASRSGRYEQAYGELSRHYISRHRMERTLRSALGYPMSLLAVLLAVAVILLVWVLPVFEGVYARLGSGPDGFSSMLLLLGRLIRAALPYIGALMAILALLLVIPLVRKKLISLGKEHFGDKGVFGKINSARFVSGLAMGISSGMTEEEAADLAASLADSNGYRERCLRLTERLAERQSLSKALTAEGFLGNTHGRRLSAAYKSGHGEEELSRLAAELCQRSEEDLEAALSRTEPVIVALACIIIGGILLGVMLPLINILNGIG